MINCNLFTYVHYGIECMQTTINTWTRVWSQSVECLWGQTKNRLWKLASRLGRWSIMNLGFLANSYTHSIPGIRLSIAISGVKSSIWNATYSYELRYGTMAQSSVLLQLQVPKKNYTLGWCKVKQLLTFAHGCTERIGFFFNFSTFNGTFPSWACFAPKFHLDLH